MTRVGWLVAAALVVIGGIAYAAVLLNVPMPAVALGAIAALAAVFMVVTRRGRASLPRNADIPVNARRDPASGTVSAAGDAPPDESKSRD